MRLLLSGLDTVECAYYLRPTADCTLDFTALAAEKERARQSKKRHSVKVEIGGMEFLLLPLGSGSGYPFILENADMTIQCGEFNDPSFFVTYRSIALWHSGARQLHQQFLRWATSLGLMPYRTESLSRVDFTFDFHLPEIDFDQDSFVTLAVKDKRHRKHRQAQTFDFGENETKLRLYDKIAEIREQSAKEWFIPLWGDLDQDVWRVEWQVRKEKLREFGIRTFGDLFTGKGDLLRYLVHDHTTLRIKSADSNRSRWPLHPLWMSLQGHVMTLDCEGVLRSMDQKEALNARLMRMAISIQGYLKRIAAIDCVLLEKSMVSNRDALTHLQGLLSRVHDPLTWKSDVQRRVNELRFGK